MTTLCLDSSGLVRRYDVLEPGSREVERLCSDDVNQLYISQLTRVELRSAMQRKHSDGAFTDERLALAWESFQAHLVREYRLIEIDEAVIFRAETIVSRRHPVRAGDAIHIATAQIVGEALVLPDLLFVTADHRQANAAAAEGLAVQIIE